MTAVYRVFSINSWKNWDKTGKAEVLQHFQELAKEDSDEDEAEISMALYEVISAVVRGHIRKEQIKPFLQEVISLCPDNGSRLVEAISLVELETNTVDKLVKQRDTLISLIRMLDLEKLYKERLDIDTLGDAGVIKNKKNFLTKQIKVRTKMFYKQQKFNLLREESEGYAKLVTELNQEINSRVTPQLIIQVIRSLIGSFNLDPNRVLDLILEAFECRPEEYEFYTGLLHLFPHEATTVSEILGFKLNNYSDNTKEAKGIYIVVALLLEAKILTLADIYDWLTPEDSSMIEAFKKEMESAKDFAQKANVVSTKDKDTENDKDKNREKEEEEKEKNEQKSNIKYNTNQKIQLCIAFLEVGNWNSFLEMSNRFPDFYFASCPPVGEALCKLIHVAIDPLYRRNCSLPPRLKNKVATPAKNCILFPFITSFDEFAEKVFPMLSVLGPYIYHDVCLMYKILRISRVILKMIPKGKGVKSSFYYDFLSVLDECLLPAVSMFESNPCIAEEVWETIKIYPYQHRYKLYGRWKNETYLLHAALIRNRTQLLKKAKYIMMRITKETIKPVSRGIGKHTHNIPGPIFEYILKQVQLYDNLIGPVVDSFKYLTSLSYDVLGYCIVEVLSLCKDRTQNDAMAISPWLQSLSSFSGSVCKKYSLDLGGILQFIANQLKSEKSIDLLLLKDIVQKMGGTDSMEDLTPDQLEAMFGGEHLRREAGQYLQEKNTKRSSMRLKDSLIENNLAIPILLLMAQQRSSIVYNQTESPHLKLVGKLYDQCQDTMVQFGSYLFQMITIEELNSKMPPIGSLLTDYLIHADVAFFLTRPMFGHLLHNKYDELRRKDKSERKLTADDKKKIFADACNEVFLPLIESIRPHYSSKIWEDMDPSFFLTFWSLTMSDLEVPTRIYDKEIKKLAEMPTNKMRKRDIERIQTLKEKLEDEKKRQIEHTERVHGEREADTWFSPRTPRSPKNDTVTTFLQLCIFPRCTFSTLDAVYCAKFVRLLHSLKTPNFSTLLCYDKMYCDITYTVTSCTEQEAHHYARFLLGTLDTVMHWHESPENFKKECSKYPGFITKYRISTHEANDYVNYENYRHVVHKWHYKITKALVTCLESGDYIQIRNAILIMQGILPRNKADEDKKEECDKDEKKKKDKKRDKDDKDLKRKKDTKRSKTEDGDAPADDEIDRDRREDSECSNVSSASGKMDPPSGERSESTRSSKRRKMEHDSKVSIRSLNAV
ncbi:THO complex subunit 2 [Armadillidium nasatum]|uniref:THO complex subunit 2 n=1 Tax=Armadillidium nasatum TaxID=96803 RepID=A0A5N5T1T2_9CRUS|nr:THO complex subunit 2 [Armadillidium nasatum]